MAATSNETLARALLAFQKDPPPVHFDATNPGFKNRYASLGAVVDAVRPALVTHGLVVVQEPCTIGEHPGLRTTIIHAESGERMSSEMLLLLDKQTPQGLGSALTYGRRYSLLALLSLVADEDDDGAAASQPRKKVASPAPVVSSEEAGGTVGDAASNGEVVELTAKLLAAADQLDALDATKDAIEKNAAKGDEAGHVAWLKRCIATAEENLAKPKFVAPKAKA